MKEKTQDDIFAWCVAIMGMFFTALVSSGCLFLIYEIWQAILYE